MVQSQIERESLEVKHETLLWNCRSIKRDEKE